jgi:uncharacterized membrane protein
VSLLSLRRVPRGVSGGVTLLGTSMAAAGAVFIGLVFALENLALRAVPEGFLRVGGAVALGGFVGALVDSILGETVQAQYEMPGTGPGSAGAPAEITEIERSPDGRPNRLVRGLRVVNNDVVNFASCAAVTAAAVLLFSLIL